MPKISFRKYVDLEVAIADEQDGLDPEENAGVDENVDEGDGDVDENAADEERDACSKCNTEGIMDIVF